MKSSHNTDEQMLQRFLAMIGEAYDLADKATQGTPVKPRERRKMDFSVRITNLFGCLATIAGNRKLNAEDLVLFQRETNTWLQLFPCIAQCSWTGRESPD